MSGRAIDHRLATGRWLRLHPGVYAFAGSTPTWHRRLIAACLAADAVVSHRAAAALWGFAGFGARVVELIVPRGRSTTVRARVHHPQRLRRHDVATIDGIPVTSAQRTLVDIAGICGSDLVEEAFDDVVTRRLVSLSKLRAMLRAQHRGRPGIALLRSLVEMRADRSSVADSRLETKMFRLFRRARLPGARYHYAIRNAGTVIAEVDVAFPDAKIAIEADSRKYHDNPRAWRKDLARRNELTALGWHVIHVTWDDVTKHPHETIERIRRMLLVARSHSRGG